MNITRLMAATCIASSLLALPVGLAQTAEAGAPATAKAPTEQAPTEQTPAVQPEALQGLSRMGAYLRTLTTFELHGDTIREEAFDDGQKIQFTGSVTYKVRRPDGLRIEVAEDRRTRQFIYDGKTLTVFSPKMGFYATVPAPATIRELLDEASDKYDIEFPLQDLFFWGTDEDSHEDLLSGVLVGYARLAGQDADQYAFREKGVDWQIWIARGAKPVPLRMVIADVDDPSKPQFEVNMVWDTAPKFATDTFAFTPPANAKAIVLNTTTPATTP
jgi:hypothetical protein